jgi:hypothetical protein
MFVSRLTSTRWLMLAVVCIAGAAIMRLAEAVSRESKRVRVGIPGPSVRRHIVIATDSAPPTFQYAVHVVISHILHADRHVDPKMWRRVGYEASVYSSGIEKMYDPYGNAFTRSADWTGLKYAGPVGPTQKRQFVDFLSVLHHVSEEGVCGPARGGKKEETLILLADDDAAPCEGMDDHIQATLTAKGSALMSEQMRMLRFSVGSNGLLLTCTALHAFVAFADASMLSDAPVYAIDALLDTWAGSQGAVYAHNLLDHGPSHSSTIWSVNETAHRDARVPGCMDTIVWWGASFDSQHCSGHLFSPCDT